MRILIGIALGFVLCCFLYASKTHNHTVLHHYILDNEHASEYSGLWPAAKRGSTQALAALAKRAEENADIYWLERAASLNSLSAQLALAKLNITQQAKQFWLTQAAVNNHAPSQFELYLTEKNTEKRAQYLHSAAINQYRPAIIALAKNLYEQGLLAESIEWLSLAAEFDPKSRYLLARVQWHLGDIQSALHNFTLAGDSLSLAKEYAAILKSNRVVDLSYLLAPKVTDSAEELSEDLSEARDANVDKIRIGEACAQQLQFVASTLDSAVQANQFAQKFAQDPRFTDFPICINPVVWLKPEQLKCKIHKHRQQCDLAPLATQAFAPNFTHLVLFLGAGTAYVQHGVMYLDQADTYSVFIHEMAHFVGFVDEYAVSPHLAESYCEQGNAPNLLVQTSQEEDVYNTSKFAQWQAYSAEMSPLRLGRSRTCARLDIDTYKPSSNITFLEHHDTNNIPDIYLLMWQALLEQQHQNIDVAEALYNTAFDEDAIEAASYWASLLEQ